MRVSKDQSYAAGACDQKCTPNYGFELTEQDIWQCKACTQEYAYHVGRMHQHLVKCDKYLTLHKTKGIQNDIMREAAALGSKQILLNILKLSMETKALLHLDFVEAYYVSGLPFTIYQDETM